MKRVAFVTNIIPPYRKSFYTKLSQIENIDLLVFYGVNEIETGRPGLEKNTKLPFNTKIITNSEKKIGPIIIRWQKDLLKAISDFNPDIIIILGISGVVTNWILGGWARINKVNILMWTCGWEAQSKDTLVYFIKKALMRIYYKIPHKILTYSTTAKEYMMELGIAKNKIDICYNGIEIDALISDEKSIRRQAKLLRINTDTSEKVLFLYVGGMLKEKKVDLLLMAFSELSKSNRNVFLWLIGDGPDIQYFKQIIKELNIKNIKYWGRIIDDVDKYFAAADIFVLPGIGGLALNQAMYWETPCICSVADGTENDLVIENATGYRFHENSVESLTKTMRRAAVELSEDKFDMLREKCRKAIFYNSNVNEMVETFAKNIYI